MFVRHFVSIATIALLLASAATAADQPVNARERAREPYTQGLEEMRAERFDAALKSFQTAAGIDPEFEMAHYMLGRVHLVQRNYTSAIIALRRSSELFTAQNTQRFATRQEGERVRRERVAELDDMISQLQQIVPQTVPIQEQIRQLQERRRQIQDLDRQQGLSPDKIVPAFVSLSLGSAYFRSGRLAEAEDAYRAAIAADPKIGEAHNNLAVVYMETGRLDDAAKAIRAAEDAGLRVNPALKDEIRRRRKSGAPS